MTARTTKEREEEIRCALADTYASIPGGRVRLAEDTWQIRCDDLLAELDAERARREAAEAQLAALRAALSAIESAIAHETLTADGELADRFSDGAMERLRAAAERMWGPDGDWLADADSAAASYRARVEAEVLEASASTIDAWEASDDRRMNGYQEAAECLRAEAAKRKTGAR